MKDKEPFVSIVTPVYNGEKYLSECIESVLSQTYQNWEYVIVNNRSTDSTVQIAESYAEKDSRVRISNNSEFLPVMDNLNHAFYQISEDSNYCKVIHSDDWMFPECISRMVSVAEEYPTVGIVGAYRLDGRKVGITGLPYPSHFNSGKKIARDFLLGKGNYFGAPSNLLIRSNLIRKRKRIYDPDYLQSDETACLDLLSESDYGFVHQVLTFTRRHEESVTETKVKKYSAYQYGYLKMMMDYGPEYLSKEEYEREYNRKVNNFYTQFARDIFDFGYGKSFDRHSSELRKLGLPVRKIKLLKYYLRELVLKGFNLLGLELKPL